MQVLPDMFWMHFRFLTVWAFNAVRLRVDLPGKGYGRKYGEPRRKAQERVRASGCLAEADNVGEVNLKGFTMF